MRSFASFVFLLALLTAGYLTWRGQQRLALLEELQPPMGSSQSFNEEVEESGPLRDERGAIIVSDPADDLGGFVPSPNARTLPVGERDLYLLELYGPLAREQLLEERRVLSERFEAERERAFREEFERGNYSVMNEDPGSDASVLVETRRVARADAGAEELQTVALSHSEHPGVYELRDTLEWLGQRLGDH